MKNETPSAALIYQTIARILERKHGVKIVYETKESKTAAPSK